MARPIQRSEDIRDDDVVMSQQEYDDLRLKHPVVKQVIQRRIGESGAVWLEALPIIRVVYHVDGLTIEVG